MPANSMPKQKLLVFELRQLGDAVQSLPFVRGAMEVFEVFICCQPGAAALYRLVIDEDRLIPWSPPWGKEKGKYRLREWDWTGLLGTMRRLRRLRCDAAVSVWADARDHLLMALSGARTRAGFPMNAQNYYGHERAWRRRQLHVGRILEVIFAAGLCRRLISRPLQRQDYLQNHLADWKQLAAALAIPWRDDTPWMAVPPASAGDALAEFRRIKAASQHPAWLIHPGARMPNRRWPVEKFETVIREVFVPQETPYLVIEPAECAAPAVVGSRGFALKTATLTDLLRAIEAVDCVLCNDTGVSHLAGALGKKVVTLFSANRPDWFAPFGNRSRVVEKDVCPFRPCIDRCEMPTFICLEAISVEAVSARVREVSTAEPAQEIAPG